jgi:hypothetical protein
MGTQRPSFAHGSGAVGSGTSRIASGVSQESAGSTNPQRSPSASHGVGLAWWFSRYADEKSVEDRRRYKREEEGGPPTHARVVGGRGPGAAVGVAEGRSGEALKGRSRNGVIRHTVRRWERPSDGAIDALMSSGPREADLGGLRCTAKSRRLSTFCEADTRSLAGPDASPLRLAHPSYEYVLPVVLVAPRIRGCV